ncbi:MAG: beta-N-acetylhexosaminidase [Bacteroidota bacterium]
MIRLKLNHRRSFLKALAGLENCGDFRILYLLILAVWGCVSPGVAQPMNNQPVATYQSVIIPQPQVMIENREAEVFNWTSFLRISMDTQFSLDERKIIAQRLAEAVKIYQFSKFFDSDIDHFSKGGYEHRFMSFKAGLQPLRELDRVENHRKKGHKKRKATQFPEIRIERIEGMKNTEEGYRLDIAHGKPAGIVLQAQHLQGVIWGLRSLQQLVEYNQRGSLIQTHIEDYPTFPYRGMHLDVSRHFYGPTDIKRYIDWLSFYKFNVFHWHLCDDQGWRIEIKRYPKLTSVGAWRVDRNKEPWRTAQPQQEGELASYGGFYTQDEVREIVAYAKARGVEIIPEIEMPGHSSAALSAYPDLSCSHLPQAVVTGGFYPKDNSSVYCAGNEATFRFLEGVLDEVMALFPDAKLIHIGGDEVDKTAWKNCLLCQQRIKVLRDVNSAVGRSADGLDDWSKPEDRLQGYFIARMEKYLNEHGRNIIGWDEILEGGLAPNAAVMSWRGEAGGIEAAKMHHPVVMTPGSPCYFDHYQGNPSSEPTAFGGMNTLFDVFKYNPIPKALDSLYWVYVAGAQGNVWTEFMVDFDRVEYMVLPRMLALGEVLWGGPVRGDARLAYRQFLDRVDAHEQFDYFKGCGFARSQYGLVQKIRSGHDTVWVELMSAGGVRPRLASGLFDTLVIRKSLAGKTWQSFVDLGVDLIRFDERVPIAPYRKTDSSVIVAVTKTMELHSSYSQESQINTLSFRGHNAFGKKVKLSLPADARYPGHGSETLTDGLFGGHYLGAHWLGFYGKDVVIEIDLDSIKPLTSITLGSLSVEPSWIFAPTEVSIETSVDGKTWELHPMPMAKPIVTVFDTMYLDLMPKSAGAYTEKGTLLGKTKYAYDEIWGRTVASKHLNYTVDFADRPLTNGALLQARYIRINAKCLKKLPANHLGAGRPAWLFLDEVVVK